jgi:hypothetical protein
LRGLPQLVGTQFQVLFHSPTGVLFTFPSRYWFTIGHQLVFSLGGWALRIQTGFHVHRSTWDTSRLDSNFAYESFTLYGWPSHAILLFVSNAILRSRNPKVQAPWFRLFRVRSPLLTESLLFSTPQGTEMFHFPWCRSEALCIQTSVSSHDAGWVAPFGNLRIKACLPLPEAYRSLPRPSSPADAKASIVRPYHLDQNPNLWLSYLGAIYFRALTMQLSKNGTAFAEIQRRPRGRV